jgi:hypothetical protein
MGKISLVKQSNKIKDGLKQRMDELDLSYTAMSEDAKKRGMNISIEALSRYFKHKDPKGGLSEINILWLCYRYGIVVTIKVTVMEYDEAKCLEMIEKYF